MKEHIPDVFHHLNNMGGPYPAPLITQVRKMRSGGSFCTLTAHEKPPERLNTCRFFGPDLKIVWSNNWPGMEPSIFKRQEGLNVNVSYSCWGVIITHLELNWKILKQA